MAQPSISSSGILERSREGAEGPVSRFGPPSQRQPDDILDEDDLEDAESEEGEPESLDSGSDFFFDGAGELAVADKTVVSIRRLTLEQKFTEGRDWEYAACWDAITKRYDGMDAPRPETLRHPTKTVLSMGSSANVIVGINDYKDQMFGQGLMTTQDTSRKPWIRLEPALHSQHPSLRLTIMGGKGGKNVTCHISPGCILRDHDSFVQMRAVHNGGKSKTWQNNGEITERGMAHSLVEFRLFLWHPDTVEGGEDAEDVSAGLQPERPVWTGITLAELQARDLEVEQKDWDDIPRQTQLIWLLRRSTNLSIFRAWPEGGAEPFNQFWNWFSTAFQASAWVGYDWFYRLQTSKDITSIDCEHRDLEPPRWLAKDVTVETDDDGYFIRVKPNKVNAFSTAAVNDNTALKANIIYPDPGIKAFEFLCAIQRNQARQSFLLDARFQGNGFKLVGVFMNHPRVAGSYLVNLWPDKVSVLASDFNLRPDPGTRIVLWAKAKGECNGNHEFTGIVVDDVVNTKAEISVMVSGPILPDSEASTGLKSNEYLVAIKFVDDPTPSNRWRGAVEEILLGPSTRTQGLDTRHLVFQSPPTVVHTTSLASQMTDEAMTAARYVDVRYKLNESQIDALYMSITSQTGHLSVQNTSTSGKSVMAAAIAHAHIVIGRWVNSRRPIIVTAPDNDAVSRVCTKFKKGLYANHRIEIVVFRGDFLREEKEVKKRTVNAKILDEPEEGEEKGETFSLDQQPDEDNEDYSIRRSREYDNWAFDRAAMQTDKQRQEEAIRPLWELADEIVGSNVNDEFAFHPCRLAAIRRWLASAADIQPHVMAEIAREYMVARKHVNNPEGRSREQMKNDRATKDDLERQCTEYYLANEVDIVFCKNSTAAHATLRAGFKPKVLLQEDAESTSVPDAITPLAAFVQSIELLVQIGNCEHRVPAVASRGFNEFIEVLDGSLFEMTINNKVYDNSFIELIDK